jgi:phospholipid transport system substrate-binding protein
MKKIIILTLILTNSIFSLNKNVNSISNKINESNLIIEKKESALAPSKIKDVTVNNNLKCENNSPCSIVRDTSIKVLDYVNNKDINNKNKIMSLIKDTVTPSFDFTLMTRYALGKNWESASIEQQKKLVDNFKQLLIYTYSSALYKFRGAKIKILSENINDKKAEVISSVSLPVQLKQENIKPIKVEYDFVKINTNSSWKAYDIKIEDTSLVTTYRNQFNDIVASSQISGLIEQLKTKVTNLEKNKYNNDDRNQNKQ